MQLRDKLSILQMSSSLIPNEYQEIEYLEFTGEQWFDTGIYQTSNIKYEFDITPYDTKQNETMIYFGAYDGTYNMGLHKAGSNYSFVYAYSGISAYRKYINFDSSTFNSRKIILADADNSITINGTVYSLTKVPTTFTCTLTSYFGNGHRSDGSYPAKFISRKVKFYEDGVHLSRYYIPVRRKSDNLGGYYDVVNRTFNPSMTSTPFVKGADV